MTNSNNWIRVLIVKQSPANAAGSKCLAAPALAQLFRDATIRLFSRETLEVKPVSKSDDMEWLILLADAENGGEVLVLPPEPVVLADGISIQFERISEAQEKSQIEKDFVIVSKEEIREIPSEVDVNGSAAETPQSNGHLENDAIDAVAAVGQQLQDFTLTSGGNDDVHENDLVSKPAIQMQLSFTQAAGAVENSLCQNSNHGVEVEASHTKLPEENLQATVKADSECQFIVDVDKNGSLNGLDEESRVEESTTEQSTMKFWQYFVGNADSGYLREQLCAISNTLFPDTQQLNKEQIQQLLSVESGVLPPPLIRVAEVLLSKARRYQPWHEIIEKLDDFATENDLGFAIDSKGLVLLFQHYLPPVKARQLYQRLAEQNSTLPFAVCLPINHGSDHQSFYLLASHFRNLFVANIPILLSIGLPGCSGKSTFLNKCFDCAFPQSTENAFHPPSIDVSLSTESKPQNYHIFDCHGDLPLAIVQLISSISSVVLVHVLTSDLKDQSPDSPLQKLLAAIDSASKILLLVRDCTESAFAKIQLPTFPTSIQPCLLGVVSVMRIASDDRSFSKAFPRFLENNLKPLLQSISPREWPEYLAPRRYFSLYEEIEKRLSDLLAESPQAATLIARSFRSMQKANELKHLLLQLPENEDETRRRIFPRSDLFAKLCETEANIGKLSQQFGDDLRLRSEAMQLEAGMRGQNKLSQLLSEILAISQSKNLEMYEEFLAVMAHFKFACGAANSEPASNLPPEYFWRELLLYAKHSDQKQLASLQDFFRLLITCGYPIEIINGDTLTFIDPDFLAGILVGKEQKKLLVVSVVGPQSSGKSTLMNHLFGSGFAVSAGRCTRGMYLSIFETSASERIAVLDSEGLLSMATKGTAFDNQMAVMLLALSHVVLVNVKGEIGRDMDNILEVALLGMQMLKVIHFKPKLLVVLRDLTDLRISKQAESIDRISDGMKSISKRIKFEFTEIDENSYVLLPSAFTEKTQPFHSREIHSPNGAFLRRIEKLFLRVRGCAAAVSQDPTAASFASIEDWVAHSKATWGTLRQSGHLLHYKTLQEYFDRDQLSQLCCDLCSDSCEQFRIEAMKFADQLLPARPGEQQSSQESAERFRIEATRSMKEHLLSASEKFVKDVENRNFASELIDEYKHCLEQRFRVALDCAQSEFDVKLGSFMVKNCVFASLEKVKRHGDNYIRSRGSEPPDEGQFEAEFESFWQVQAETMRQQLVNLKKSSEKIDAQLRSVFSDLLSKNARFSKYPNRLTCANVSIVENISDVNGLKQHIISCTGLWRTTVGAVKALAATVSEAIGKPMETTILSTFQLAVREVKDCVLSVVASAGAVFNAESVERGFETVEASISKFDKMLRKFGAKFDLSFFTLWFSFLFEKLREKLVLAEETSIASNLSIFESHKKQLLSAFTSMLRSRYNDLDSTRELAQLMVAAIVRQSNDAINRSFLARIRNVARLEPAELLEICERRNSPKDLKEYVLRCPRYMRQVFADRFRATGKELRPEFESMLKSRVGKAVAALQASVNCWEISINAEEIKAASNANNGTLSEDVRTLLFLSLKACLSGAKQPEGAAKLTKLGASRTTPSLAYIFHLIPNAFGICDPTKFCENLKGQIDQVYADSDIKLEEDGEAFMAVTTELGDYAIGCIEVCPICGAKCSCANDGHAKHQTKHHRITAFAGCHEAQSRKLTFDICTAKSVHRTKWTHYTPPDEFLPFDQHMAKYYPNWIIPLLPNAEVEIKNILRWMQVKDDIVGYYRSYLDNTPPEWAAMAERYCPVCLRLWEECTGGQKRILPCGHLIGAECLALLRGAHVDDQSCPMCRGPLE